MKKIRWGIVGCGKMADKFCDCIAKCKNATVFAVASRSLDKAKTFAEKHNAKLCFGSYAEIYSCKEIDIIYIATPQSEHYKCCKAALEAGQNVFCEKPITMNSRELEELIALAKKKDLFFSEAVWTMHFPVVKQVSEWIASGRIGKIKYVSAEIGKKVPHDHRLLKYELGGGAFLDMGIYSLIIANLAFQQAKPTKLIAKAEMTEGGVDAHTAVLAEYDGGYASLCSSIVSSLHNSARIVGENGNIEISEPFWHPSTATLKAANISEAVTVTPISHGYEYEIEAVCRALGDGKKELDEYPIEATRAVMSTLDEIRSQIKYVHTNDLQYADERKA